MWLSPSKPSHKAQVITKVKQWTSHMQKENESKLQPQAYALSDSTVLSAPPSTTISKTTQSTAITSINNEDCGTTMDDKET